MWAMGAFLAGHVSCKNMENAPWSICYTGTQDILCIAFFYTFSRLHSQDTGEKKSSFRTEGFACPGHTHGKCKPRHNWCALNHLFKEKVFGTEEKHSLYYPETENPDINTAVRGQESDKCLCCLGGKHGILSSPWLTVTNTNHNYVSVSSCTLCEQLAFTILSWSLSCDIRQLGRNW